MIAVAFALAVALPRIDIIDDSGRTRSIEQWKGSPAILVPMYTRCPTSCPMITEGLKKATAAAKADPTSYRVVLFSFDPRDTPADLREFRARHQIPIAWSMATAKPADVRRLLEALDVRVSDFMMHPNVAIAITPDLRPAKSMFGTSFSGSEIDAALDIARGGHDWIGRYGGYALAALLLAAILSGMVLAVAVTSPSRSASETPDRP